MAQRPVRVGVQVWPQLSTFAEQRATWRRAEELGVDDVFTWDHFFPLNSDGSGAHFEGWTLLAAMAEATERVRVGTLVSSVGYRNPDLLADMARTIDHISGGRAILGIGAGWAQRDYESYGYEYGDVPSRAALFAQAVPRIVERLGKLDPPPISQPLPILIGGAGERTTLRMVARYGHIWNTLSTDMEVFARKNAVLERWCETVGRDSSEITRSIAITNPRMVEELDTFYEAGLTHVSLGMPPQAFDEAAMRRMVDWRDRVNA